VCFLFCMALGRSAVRSRYYEIVALGRNLFYKFVNFEFLSWIFDKFIKKRTKRRIFTTNITLENAFLFVHNKNR